MHKMITLEHSPNPHYITPMTTLQLTANAAKRIRFLSTKQEKPDLYLRLSVDSGGCSGFKYNFNLHDATPSTDDVIIEADGAKLVIDTASLPFVTGSVVDFVSDLSGESFQVKNPLADSSCGCGVSFAVKM